jgi:hypothetical protein
MIEKTRSRRLIAWSGWDDSYPDKYLSHTVIPAMIGGQTCPLALPLLLKLPSVLSRHAACGGKLASFNVWADLSRCLGCFRAHGSKFLHD